mgnify:CR=1 FL=1
MNDQGPRRKDSVYSQIGLALSIPSMLLAGPLVGYGIGYLVRQWTGWGEWVTFFFIVLGFVAAVRETIKIIRKLS